MSRSRHALALFAGLAIGWAGCLINTEEPAGKVCETDADCDDPLLQDDGTRAYRCLPDSAGADTKHCFLLYPPGAAVDAGVDAGPARTVYWCDEVEPLMQIYCSSCHGEDRSGGLFLPFRADVYEDVDGGATQGGLNGAKTMAPKFKQRVFDQRNMPPPGAGMPTDEERAVINDWVLSGAPFCDGGM